MNETAPAADKPVEVHPPQHARHRRVSGRSRRRLIITVLAVLGVCGILVAAGMLTGFLPKSVVAGDPKATGLNEPPETGPLRVKAVRPARDSNFRITTRQFAVVEPYYQAGVRSRVAGVVRSVSKDIGESVRAGELLVEIDVPDLKQAVEQKEAVVVQRERELASARADLAVAKSAVEAAQVGVKVKEVEVRRAIDIRAARKIDVDAVTILFKQNEAVKSKLDAAVLDYQAAVSGVEAAEADVEKAKVEQAGKAAAVEKANADIELKLALVDVARKDRDAAAIQFGYTRLYAPFDGVIVTRATDPGRFVDAGRGPSEPLITVARTDLVTVVAKVPDNAAPFVSAETEAVVEFERLPGVTVRGRITRFSQVIDPADQTMRVEVDVFNGTADEYRKMLGRTAAEESFGPLSPFDPAGSLIALAAVQARERADHKDSQSGAARIPDWGPTGRARKIVPGTTASMRLDLEQFGESFLLPSAAVYSKAGQAYLLLVEDGVTRAVPVTVQMNDGTLTKVAAVVPGAGGKHATRELTGNEVIVTARQLEVGEGRRVTPVFEK